MRQELDAITKQLRQATGAPRLTVMPQPYSRGHFRIYGTVNAANDAQFTHCVHGGNTFVTLSDDALRTALACMDAHTPSVVVHPQHSPLDTLLYQILAHGFEEGGMDCPLLARLCLDLDEDAQRSTRVISVMQRHMGAWYAQLLRQGRKQSALPAVARQVIFYKRKALGFEVEEKEQ